VGEDEGRLSEGYRDVRRRRVEMERRSRDGEVGKVMKAKSES